MGEPHMMAYLQWHRTKMEDLAARKEAERKKIQAASGRDANSTAWRFLIS